MIPLRDTIPYRTFPAVNYAVIGICTLVFFLQLGDEPVDELSLVTRYGMIPALVHNPDQPVLLREAYVDEDQSRVIVVERPYSPVINPWITLVTCVFLHGGWMHFLGNMWFLHIFGDNVEDRLGHFGYAVFYLASGVLASAAHLYTNADSSVPTIGASGAIAGVMGAYFLLYPKAEVDSLVPLFFFIQIIRLPAPLFLGIWFMMQLFQGTAAITSTATTGVAWWAHIGGFAFGFAAAGLMRLLGQTNPPVVLRLRDGDIVRMSDYPRY